MTPRMSKPAAVILVFLSFLAEVALAIIANFVLSLHVPGRQYSGQEMIEIALRTGRGDLIDTTLGSFTLVPDQKLLAIGVLLGLALSMALAAAGLALYAGTRGRPKTWGAWSLVPWPGSFAALVALTLLPHGMQDGASARTDSGGAVKDTPSPTTSGDHPGSGLADGPQNKDRSLVLGLILIPVGLACQLPVLMEVWGPLSRKLLGLHPRD